MQTLLATTRAPVTELGTAEALPRLQPPAARVFSRLYSGSAPVDISLRGLPHRLQWGWPARPVREQGGWDAYRFRLGEHVGHVALDPLAVSGLLAERRSELLPRELRYLLWADALHAVASAVEAATQLRLDWTPPDEAAMRFAPDDTRAAWFSLSLSPQPEGTPHQASGVLQFDEPAALDTLLAAWPRALPAAAERSSLDGLRMPLSFVLGHTALTLQEIGGVRPGDIVSIEDWSSSGAGLLLGAQVGGPAGLRLAGLAEGSRITLLPLKDTAMNREPAAASTVPDEREASPLPLDRLDAMEVNLRFEVGDLSLSLGELRTLRPGHVFELVQPLNRSLVRILAHGNLLGKGYLVAVGDQLGVRVTEFAPHQL